MNRFLSFGLLLVIAAGPAVGQGNDASVHHGVELLNPDLDTSALKPLPVLQGGRFKPFDSLAREWIRSITLDVRFLRVEPVHFYLFLLFQPEKARAAKIIHLPTAGIAKDLGYEIKSKEDNWTSYDEIKSNASVLKAMREANEKDVKSARESEILHFSGRWNLVAGITGHTEVVRPHPRGGIFPAFPPADGKVTGPDYAWKGPDLLQVLAAAPSLDADGMRAEFGWSQDVIVRMHAWWKGVGEAYVSGDQARFDAAAKALVDGMRGLDPPHYPAAAVMAREVDFNQSNYFSHARWSYVGTTFLAVLLMLIAAFVKAPWLNHAKVYVPMAMMIVGLFLHTKGLWIRTELSGRAMIGNFYDSMVFVAGASALFGVIFDLVFRRGWLVLIGSALGWITLAVATSNPATLDPKIAPLMPVLINNYWIHIHVPTMMCSYAALGLTAVLGHVYVIKYLFRDPKNADMKDLTRFMGVTMPIGVVLLFVGMVLGGVWADDSWGRFWGWDPKETWSFITWLVFIVLVHGYWAGWLRDFGMAVGTMVGGWSLLWTYWGANFFQSGLHSYAGADPSKEIPTWLWTFVAVEFTILGVAALAWKRKHRPTPPGPGDATPA